MMTVVERQVEETVQSLKLGPTVDGRFEDNIQYVDFSMFDTGGCKLVSEII